MTPQKIRVLCRMSQCNPRRFIVKDPQKIQKWVMLSRQDRAEWNGRYGIRITVIA